MAIFAYSIKTYIFCCDIGISFSVELPVQAADDPIYVQTNQTDINGMVFHYINLGNNINPVLVSVYPEQNSNAILEVYVGFNSMPTLEEYSLKTMVNLFLFTIKPTFWGVF